MKLILTNTLCALFLSSCAFESVKNGQFAYTGVRVGTDTEVRTVDGGGVKLATINENNSKSFKEVTSVAKWLIVADATKSIASTVAGAVTKTNLAKETTAQKLAEQQTAQKLAEQQTTQKLAEINAAP